MGVFALVPRGQVAATLLVALALDKTGTVRGSFLDLPTGTSGPLSGALDKDTQIVAWRTATNGTTVMQTGLNSLTKDQATVLAHSDDGWTRIMSSLRLRQPPAPESVSRNAADDAEKPRSAIDTAHQAFSVMPQESAGTMSDACVVGVAELVFHQG